VDGYGSCETIDKCSRKHAENEMGGAVAHEDVQQARAVLGRYGQKRQCKQSEDHPGGCQDSSGNAYQAAAQFIGGAIQDQAASFKYFVGDL